MRSIDVRKVRLRMAAFAVTVGLATGVAPLAVSDSASASEVGPAQSTLLKATSVNCDRSIFSFVDVPWDAKFRTEITWMVCQGISRGTPVDGEVGHFLFKPKEALTREAMAAFLFRLQERNGSAGDTVYQAPAVSPFVDVQPGDKFYREIAWMHENGISTGTAQPSGKPVFGPKETLTREAMAAFLFRDQRLHPGIDKTIDFVTPPVTKFTDITPKSRFYREIAWMDAAKVSTGVRVGSTVEYQPKQSLTREAMAAFLYRLFWVP